LEMGSLIIYVSNIFIAVTSAIVDANNNLKLLYINRRKKTIHEYMIYAICTLYIGFKELPFCS